MNYAVFQRHHNKQILTSHPHNYMLFAKNDIKFLFKNH